MPGFDGRGPEGIGPTGGQRGFCGEFRRIGIRRRPLRRRIRQMVHPGYQAPWYAPAELEPYPEYSQEERLQDLTERAEQLREELEIIQSEMNRLKSKTEDNKS